MAKKQRIITIDDFRVNSFRLVRREDGTWGVTMHGAEVDAEGNVLQRAGEYVEMPASVQTKWEKVAADLEKLAKQQRGLEDGEPEVSKAKAAAAKGRKGK